MRTLLNPLLINICVSVFLPLYFQILEVCIELSQRNPNNSIFTWGDRQRHLTAFTMQLINTSASVFICLLSWLYSNLATAQHYVPIQSLSGRIGGGNYTYYKLLRSGNIQIQLRSIEGDADMYVSQSVLHPTYELDNFDLQSATCGEDVVEIPESFKRPVGIGIYGHPRHRESTYECLILVSGSDELPSPESFRPSKEEVEEEPILWTIFVNVLKVVIDILVWWIMSNYL